LLQSFKSCGVTPSRAQVGKDGRKRFTAVISSGGFIRDSGGARVDAVCGGNEEQAEVVRHDAIRSEHAARESDDTVHLLCDGDFLGHDALDDLRDLLDHNAVHANHAVEFGDFLLRGVERGHRVPGLVAHAEAAHANRDAGHECDEKGVLLHDVHGMSPFAQRMCTSMSSPSSASMSCWKARSLWITARCMRLWCGGVRRPRSKPGARQPLSSAW
jgi:hypothetical protein